VVYAPAAAAAAAVVPICAKGNQYNAESACMAHSLPEKWATEFRIPLYIMTNQITISGTPAFNGV